MKSSEAAVLFLVALIVLLPILWGVSTYLWLRARWRVKAATAALAHARQRASAAEEALANLRQRFAPVVDLDDELETVRSGVAKANSDLLTLRNSYSEKRAVYDRLVAEIAIFDERLAFAEMGVYEPHFDFTDSDQYKAEIGTVRERQKRMISNKTAVFCATEWSVEGSKAKGATMTNRGIRLTLRAFNNECEAAIANTRWNNVNAMEKRIVRAKEQIDKLNETLNIEIDSQFVGLKLDELHLTHEYREKLKAEKEERAEAARLAREEQRLLRDLEKATEDEARFADLLAKAKAEAATVVGDKLNAFSNQIEVLERDLAEARAKTERAKALAERTRTGWVYIISNIGSFGEGIVKIGLTRRLNPMDRIRELGDASVPFKFDVHAIIYSEDAPALESALHSIFEPARVNPQNLRKEFFRTGLDLVEQAVHQLAPEAPFFKDVEAQEYRETMAKRREAFEQREATEDRFPAEI